VFVIGAADGTVKCYITGPTQVKLGVYIISFYSINEQTMVRLGACQPLYM